MHLLKHYPSDLRSNSWIIENACYVSFTLLAWDWFPGFYLILNLICSCYFFNNLWYYSPDFWNHKI